jgi:hypothetical protein
MLDGSIRMREHVVKRDPLGAVPKKLMELAIIAADVVQAHPWGAVRHTQRFGQEGGTVPELIEATALAMIEAGVHSYKTCGREVIEFERCQGAIDRALPCGSYSVTPSPTAYASL